MCYRFLGGSTWAGMGVRYCPNCTPRPHRILFNVFKNDWCVHFVEGQHGIGPWLLCDAREQVEGIIAWGHAAAEDVRVFWDDLTHCGFSSVALHLSDAERAALIKRGRGWPWNGFELLKMKAEGKYPPTRLATASRDDRLAAWRTW